MRSEASLHPELRHPNIVGFEEIMETEAEAHLLVEKLGGGELFDRVKQRKRFSEESAALVAVQVLQALAYMHHQGIVHRDIKLENLVFERPDSDDGLKIIDFGFAGRLDHQGTLTTMCGTPQYVAPEVLSKKPYTEKVDVWSAGCVVYIALTGKALFKGSPKEVHTFEPHHWSIAASTRW
jgi:serine/threonine protein kinase